MTIWLPIPNWPMYEVSDEGSIRSLHHFVPKILKQATLPQGHKYIRMCKGDGSKMQHILVHRAVALAHIGPPPFVGAEVRHLDGDPSNNRKINLKWGSRSRNNQDRKWHGAKGFKLTAVQVSAIRAALKRGGWGVGKKLADQFGVSQATISTIRRGHAHTDVE